MTGGDRRRPEPSDELIATIQRAQSLFGPDAPPALGEEIADEATLQTHVEAILPYLRGIAADDAGQRGRDAARAAYEIADLARLHQMHTAGRRINGLSAIQRALADLRSVGSVELMLDRSTQVLCEHIGFDRALLWRIEGDTLYPASAYDPRDGDLLDTVQALRDRLGNLVLADLTLESEMIRRRTPVIVHDAPSNLRAFKPLMIAAGIQSYVAAPIVPEGKVIGFLQADLKYQRRELDAVDRDILWAFAEGYGFALERTLLLDQVRQQRQRIRKLLAGADELINEMGETEVRIVRADGESAVRAATFLPAGGSRIQALLTPREIEVMELLVHGATNKQIADRLVVTEATAKSHVTNIFRKLRAANRAEAVHRYMQLLARDRA